MRDAWRIYGGYWRGLSAELGEVSLHGDIRGCARTHSVERRNRGG